MSEAPAPGPTPIAEHGTRGILNPAAGFHRFLLRRHAPAADLAGLVDWHWLIDWALPEPFEQEILPHPCVNMSIEARGSAVHGTGTKRQVARLEGVGRVVAAKFKPGGFFPFARVPMRSLVDHIIPIGEAFGSPDGALALDRAVLDPSDDAQSITAIETFLRARRLSDASDDPALADTMTLAARAQADRTIHRAEDLARLAGVSVRTLHRSFQRYIGVGPKWVIQRARVHEASERVVSGEPVAWAALALELGYHDQAHLIHDFKAQTGFTPAAYAKRCAAAPAPR